MAATDGFLSRSALSAIPSTLSPLTIRLDRSNYAYWRSQALHSVEAHGLEGILLGSEVCPPSTIVIDRNPDILSPNPAYEAWRRLDKFLITWLVASVTDPMIGNVVRCKSSNEAWRTLEHLFFSSSKARILQLKAQFQSTKKGSMTVDEYILKMRCIADSLIAAGHSITDDDIILQLLGGFGPDYESVVVNLAGRETLTLPELQFALQSHEMRIESYHSGLESTMEFQHPSANFVSKKSFSPNYGGSSNQMHNRSFQAPRGQANRGGRAPTFRGGGRTSHGNRIICQLCGKTGHTVIKCYHRFDQNFVVPTSFRNNEQHADNQRHQPHAYFAQSGDSNAAAAAWFLDSGATDHVTPEEENLTHRQAYSGNSKLVVGQNVEGDSCTRNA